jgi:hypothetical protein
MSNKNKEFKEKFRINQKQSELRVHDEIREITTQTNDFFQREERPNQENRDPFNLVNELDTDRKVLFKKIFKNKTNLSKVEILTKLKKHLKNKKKNILNLIRENRGLEKKWKNLNLKYEELQKNKVDQYEYMKHLIIKDAKGLNSIEKSIVSKINNVSKSQIKKEISQILEHKTEFQKVDQKDFSKSYIDQLKLNESENNNQNSVPRLYSD